MVLNTEKVAKWLPLVNYIHKESCVWVIWHFASDIV